MYRSNLTETVGQNASTSPLTLAEIQKAERERRSEMYRLEQAQQQTQAILEQQNKQDNVLKWKLKPQNQTKSLAEIQAEEAKQRQTIQLSMANVSDFFPFSHFFTPRKKTINWNVFRLGSAKTTSGQEGW